METVRARFCLIYDSALKSSATWRSFWSVYEPHESPWVMNSRCIFEEYHVYTVEREIGILRHITSWCHIASHPTTFFILDDYVFIGGWEILDI